MITSDPPIFLFILTSRKLIGQTFLLALISLGAMALLWPVVGDGMLEHYLLADCQQWGGATAASAAMSSTSLHTQGSMPLMNSAHGAKYIS